MAKSFEKEFEDQSLQALYRKMKKTSKARFECARRLRRHHSFTLWGMSLFSAGLIVLSLISTFGIKLHVEQPMYTFLQTLLSLFVLVISLLLSSSNYSDRAEKMHRCALEINQICHEILPSCKENNDSDLYHETQKRYALILDSYENHEPIDFSIVKLGLPEDYSVSDHEKTWIYIRYWLSYWIHGFLILVLLSVFIIVLWS
jgi:SMODS and SLOG-associating 2TM effector domain family 5